MKLTNTLRLFIQPELMDQQEDGLVGLARELAHRFNLPTTLIKFVIVGGIGFVIYQAMFWLLYDSPVFWFFPDKDTRVDLLLLHHPDIRLLLASVIGVEVAIFFQFNSHDRWTFRNRNREGNLLARFLKFNATSFVSPLIIVATVNVMTPLTGVTPYFWNLVGVALGFIWNWTVNSFVIWPHFRHKEVETEPPPV